MNRLHKARLDARRGARQYDDSRMFSVNYERGVHVFDLEDVIAVNISARNLCLVDVYLTRNGTSVTLTVTTPNPTKATAFCNHLRVRVAAYRNSTN